MTKQEIAINNIRTNANRARADMDHLSVLLKKGPVAHHDIVNCLRAVDRHIERVLSEVANLERADVH